ncbi:uncharacterized protein LOC106157269 [Lingula anatina]|uniref:Uncharacterized protein LOC106157269 n=1 Tax=Lingula anatina TaxID=7574 RepID=A0A1S3HQI6_LINAN|nr:uncharacterized protein LOC106157269 [Lingula anatina]|eukprot:XP_013388318.1 uncharacterized protein LOC106157269 [Lingula anatina]
MTSLKEVTCVAVVLLNYAVYSVWSSCPPIVSRAEWGANPPVQTTNLTLPVEYIVVHHTAWDRCFTEEDCVKQAKRVQDYHQGDKGWWDLGYNFMVGEDGRAYEGRGWTSQGAHARGFNSKSIGITIFGDFRWDMPKRNALEVVKSLIVCAKEQGVIQDNYTVIGHMQAATPSYTECPGGELLCEISTWDNWKPFQFNGTFTFPANCSEPSDVCDSIISRSKWGARPPKSADVSMTSLPAHYVVIHQTGLGRCFGDCTSNVRQVQALHQDQYGWNDIGFNFLVGENGGAYEGRGWYKQGQLADRFDSRSLSIAFLGDFENVTPMATATNAVKRIIRCAIKKGILRNDYTLIGHTQADDIGQTAPPGGRLLCTISKWDHWIPEQYNGVFRFPPQCPRVISHDQTVKAADASKTMTVNDECPDIVSRAQWGARPPTEITNLTLPVQYVVVHHTSWDRCFTRENCSAEMRKIQIFHQDVRHWADIGYNFGVGEDGRAYEGRGWYRRGAHARRINGNSTGIVVMGNFEDVIPLSIATDMVKKLIRCGVQKGVLRPDYILVGHRQTDDIGHTTCPGGSFLCEITKWDHWQPYQFNGTFHYPSQCPRADDVTAVSTGSVQYSPTYGNCHAVVDRATWGAESATDVIKLQLPVKYVIVHHTAGRRCFTERDCVSQVRGIQRYHQVTRGWWDIGYNFLVGEDGRVYEGRGWLNQGAHARGFNSQSIGISIMGDFRKHSPSRKAIAELKQLIKCGVDRGVIQENFTLIGHKQAAKPGYTECPGSSLLCEIALWEHWEPYQFNGTFSRVECLNTQSSISGSRTIFSYTIMPFISTLVALIYLRAS